MLILGLKGLTRFMYETFESFFLTLFMNIEWFEKLSIPPPQKGFYLRSPTSLEVAIN